MRQKRPRCPEASHVTQDYTLNCEEPDSTRAIAFYRKHGYQSDGAVEHLKLIGDLPKIRMTRLAEPGA